MVGTIYTSATTLVSIWNTQVFRMALMALTEPRKIWQKITCFPSARRRVDLETYHLYFAPGIWWRIRTTRTAHVLHSLQGLQLCCCCLHNAWRCLCLCLAKCHSLPLGYCQISDATLSPCIISFEMVSRIKIQSSLRIHHFLLHLLCHYLILQVWNILSNLDTL